MKKIVALVSSYLFLLTPMAVFAAEDLGEITNFFEKIITFINSTLIPLMFAVALLVFLYGIFKYFILGGGDEGSRKEGRQLMMYSIVAFVVMSSIFGIVALISNGLGFSDKNAKLNIPTITK